MDSAEQSALHPRSQQQIEMFESSDRVSEFPSTYFLDHDVFLYHKLDLPTVNLTLGPIVLEAITSPLAVSAKYFDWVHLWMPMVSKNRWYTHHLNPLISPKSDVKVLLFCMKLVMWAPGAQLRDREPRTEYYPTAKQIFLEAEQRGAFSLQMLQAMLLLAIYEYSHAIYPGAYMTIAACARYGVALGIDKQRKEEIELSDFDLEQQEERRRVWWAIVVLDRMITRESPSSPEPRPDDLLPVHDQAWDDGIIDEGRIYPVSSPTSTNMGMLARLSQAAHLLGRVLRHKKYPTDDAQFNLQEQTQLNRALRALINLTYAEGATRFMPICPQTAICFSALIILNSNTSSAAPSKTTPHQARLISPYSAWEKQVEDQDVDAIAETLEFLRPIAEESAVSTALFFRRQPWSIEKASPLLLHWTYLIAVTFLRVRRLLIISARGQTGRSLLQPGYQDTADDMVQQATRGFEAMRQKLSLLGHQWCAADTYLRILEARTMGDMP